MAHIFEICFKLAKERFALMITAIIILPHKIWRGIPFDVVERWSRVLDRMAGKIKSVHYVIGEGIALASTCFASVRNRDCQLLHCSAVREHLSAKESQEP